MTLNPSIKILILKFNNFHSVDASFNFYQELELVDLSWNHLVSIPNRAFSNQRRLVQLRINSNKISKISERTFSGLGKLQVLNLEENLLE
jgi:Leucine-rich repeat (LRR) protein